MLHGKKLALSLAVTLFAMMPAGIYAAGSSKPITVAMAKSIISDYKVLRSQCATTEGQIRKSCYAELNNSNELYVLAKRILNAEKSGKSPAHYVSQVY